MQNESTPVHIERPTRKGLPLVFKLGAGSEEIMTGHDTGTEANHMSLELAQRLGHDINSDEEQRGGLQPPTGKFIKSIGRVTVKVQFARGEDPKAKTFTCYFIVFSHPALPALIVMAFLNTTETITTYTSRLVALLSG
ncbi:hypothetical protein EK21DRAFT_118994 [Setomelanomma holmii]|uniref:Uncharacterized protein n=1 Tax=Setomelanomma holmii TaxID=210430 RepID=A0A9P4LEF8_9PLEO|nr:hypothetical protein EK21DRAFT_118994 [Setomelanomma holmii]